MNVPYGFDDATEEMQREYLVGNKSSDELAGVIRALLDTDDGKTDSPQLNKAEKAEIYLRLQDE